MQVRKGENLPNIIDRNDRDFESRRVAKLINRLHKEKIMGDTAEIKLTFVVLYAESKLDGLKNRVLQSLRKLQEERKWAIIIASKYEAREPLSAWLSLHRYIVNSGLQRDETLLDLFLKDLKDVIQNPDYDRYDMAYRWAMTSNDFSCLRQITEYTFWFIVGQMFTFQ